MALHATLTGSPHAKLLVDNWPAEVAKFWKIVPHAPTPDWPKPFYRFAPTEPTPAKIEV